LGRELRKTYERLCRGETDKSPRRLRGLKCRLVHENSSFLRIAPLKLEELYENPKIVIFHEVIYESEIKKLQALAKPIVSEFNHNERFELNYFL
jgi:prolyl 4-hydroxylase